MKRYINYLKYVLKHKYYVLIAGRTVGKTNPFLWYRLLMHDMSKFKPSEFIPYAKTFYNSSGMNQYDETYEFNVAWNAHQKVNKHHWQYWLLKMDRGDIIELDMPEIYVQEMICDWLGAGRVINGVYDYQFNWYKNNNKNIQVSNKTKELIKKYIKKISND